MEPSTHSSPVWLEATCGHELRWDSDEPPPGEWDCADHGVVGLWAQRLQPSPDDLSPMPERECRAKSWQLDGFAICRGHAGHEGGHVWEVQ